MGSRNFTKREHVRMALDYLHRRGIKPDKVDITGRGHVCIKWHYQGQDHQIVGSTSPRSRVHAARNMIHDIRMKMENKYGR
jgi:hypothetical protein